MALSASLDRPKEWEDAFVKKFGVTVDSEEGLPKMIGAFLRPGAVQSGSRWSGFREASATPERHTRASGAEEAGGGPTYGNGGAAQGAGGGECKVSGHGKDENGGGAPIVKLSVAEN